MVSNSKEELKNGIEVENVELSEDEQIKLKLDAVMKAKAKEYAMAKLEAEKKAKKEVLGEKEKDLNEKLAAVERIKAERKAREEATKERIKAKKAIEEARKAEERAALEKERRKEAEKKAADMRLRALAAKKAADKVRDEHLARKAEQTIDEAAKEAAARVQAAEEEKELAKKAEIKQLEKLIHKLEVEKNLVPEEPIEEEKPQEEALAETVADLAETTEDTAKPVDELEHAIKTAEQRQEKIHEEVEKKKWEQVEADKKLAAQAKWERENGVPEDSLKDKFMSVLAAPIYLHDTIQDACDSFLEKLYKDFVSAVYKIASGYRHSQKVIGLNLLLVCMVCGIVVTVLNHNTVYEYAYNGKVLGYVENQDDVTNVLAIASEQLNALNTESTENIEFSAGDNITFNVVDSNGKDIDDADDTINKLAYMTDIEVEAYGIYEDGNLVTVVKSNDAAEKLLEEVKGILGTPDEGMEIVSVDFNKALSIEPVKVLLTSVQSNSAARKQMTKGGNVELYHLVEADETMESITEDFSVSALDVYTEDNASVATSLNVGDKVCIHKDVEPVSVKLVEQGKMKEIVPYETIEKESKDYYKGDEVVDVTGVDGIQIFEGTVTKVGGKVTNRKTKNMEVIREKVDEIILIGIAKRPKTAPTGVFKNPMLPGTYVVTSHMGYRWGRQHEGVDMGTPVGTAVYASDGGTVTFVGVSGGYGNLIIIDHGNGMTTRYGHLSSFGVREGQKVYQGQYIAASGNSGRSTGPHLHFEIRNNGTPINPEGKVSGGI